jgi:hypothetical protein
VVYFVDADLTHQPDNPQGPDIIGMVPVGPPGVRQLVSVLVSTTHSSNFEVANDSLTTPTPATEDIITNLTLVDLRHGCLSLHSLASSYV